MATSSGFMLEPLNQYVNSLNSSFLKTTHQSKYSEGTSMALGWNLSEQVVFSWIRPSHRCLKKKNAGICGAECHLHVTVSGTVVQEGILMTHIVDANGIQQMQSNHPTSVSELLEYNPHRLHTCKPPNSSLPSAEPLDAEGGSARLVVHSSASDGLSVCRQPSLITPREHSSPSDTMYQLTPPFESSSHVLCDNNVLHGTGEEEGVSTCPNNVTNGEPKSQVSEGSHCCDMKAQRVASNHQLSYCNLSHEPAADVNSSEFCTPDCLNGDKLLFEGIREEVVQELDSVLAPTVQRSKLVTACRMPYSYVPPDMQLSLSDSALYLESLGADYCKIFRHHPKAMSCTVHQLRALVSKLEYYGLKWTEQGRVFNMCPRILSLDPEDDLLPITNFLFREVGLPPGHFGKVVKRCPRLLVADISEEVRPTLWFLRHLGYKKLGHVVSNNPSLLSFSVERKLRPTLRFFEGLGFSCKEGASMVVRFPAIFNYSLSENLQPKYDFLVHEMGGSKKDLLALPQYFGYSLERRIKPRYECLRKHGISLSVPVMLRLSDAEFNARYALCPTGEGECSSKELLVLSGMMNTKHYEPACGPDSILVMQGLECPRSQDLLMV